MKVTLKDGSVKEYSESKSVYDIALDISEGLARAACAGEVNGEVVDLRTVVDNDCELNILTQKDDEGIRVVRHTCSHVLAEAVKHGQSGEGDEKDYQSRMPFGEIHAPKSGGNFIHAGERGAV